MAKMASMDKGRHRLQQELEDAQMDAERVRKGKPPDRDVQIWRQNIQIWHISLGQSSR